MALQTLALRLSPRFLGIPCARRPQHPLNRPGEPIRASPGRTPIGGRLSAFRERADELHERTRATLPRGFGLVQPKTDLRNFAFFACTAFFLKFAGFKKPFIPYFENFQNFENFENFEIFENFENLN